MIHRVFDALDSALSAIVPLLYLIGLAAGTLAYFSGLVVDFNVAVGVTLAIAAECHSYLVQRRMRMARARLNHVQVSDSAYGQLEGVYARQRNILIALIVFSTYNSIQFVASTWQPSGWLPAPLQILVRGAIVPGLFYLAGELTPLITEPADVLAHASREMTFAAVRTMSRQWSKRLRRARKHNLDMAPIAVTLLHDAGDFAGASRIRMIAEGLTAAEEGRMPLPLAPANTVEVEIAPRQLTGEQPHNDQPPTHPTGPGTPIAAASGSDDAQATGNVLQLHQRRATGSERRGGSARRTAARPTATSRPAARGNSRERAAAQIAERETLVETWMRERWQSDQVISARRCKTYLSHEGHEAGLQVIGATIALVRERLAHEGIYFAEQPNGSLLRVNVEEVPEAEAETVPAKAVQ